MWHTTLALPRPTFDEVIRKRLALLMGRMGLTAADVGAALGHEERTIVAWLTLDGSRRQPLMAAAVDEVLLVIGAKPIEVLQPVVDDADVYLLGWVKGHSPQPPLRSHAHLRRLSRDDHVRSTHLRYQGLLDVCGDPDDRETWYLRLTQLGFGTLDTS